MLEYKPIHPRSVSVEFILQVSPSFTEFFPNPAAALTKPVKINPTEAVVCELLHDHGNSCHRRHPCEESLLLHHFKACSGTKLKSPSKAISRQMIESEGLVILLESADWRVLPSYASQISS